MTMRIPTHHKLWWQSVLAMLKRRNRRRRPQRFTA